MGDHEHHHEETFITKYIFSQDHKMIAKQFLITGMTMGVIGVIMSVLFRILQYQNFLTPNILANC